MSCIAYNDDRGFSLNHVFGDDSRCTDYVVSCRSTVQHEVTSWGIVPQVDSRVASAGCLRRCSSDTKDNDKVYLAAHDMPS